MDVLNLLNSMQYDKCNNYITIYISIVVVYYFRKSNPLFPFTLTKLEEEDLNTLGQWF